MLYTETCTFCKLVKTKEESEILFEDEETFAFLDNRPLFAGHTLLIPKKHFKTLSDIPGPLLYRLFINVQSIDIAVQKATGADGSFIAVNNRVSQSVPHLHVHIVPRKRRDGLRGFFWPRIKYENESVKKMFFQKIKSAISI